MRNSSDTMGKAPYHASPRSKRYCSGQGWTRAKGHQEGENHQYRFAVDAKRVLAVLLGTVDEDV